MGKKIKKKTTSDWQITRKRFFELGSSVLKFRDNRLVLIDVVKKTTGFDFGSPLKICAQKFELIDVVKIESSLSFQLRLKILNKRFTLIELLEILGFFPLTKKYLYLPQKVIQMSKSEKQQVGLCNFLFLRI